MILAGNGAAELLTWSARNAAEIGTSALITPGFSEYARALHCWNGDYICMRLPLCWSSETPQAFPYTQTTKVLWINNPHNPTGQLWSRSSIENLLSDYKLVICDEAFIPLVLHGE